MRNAPQRYGSGRATVKPGLPAGTGGWGPPRRSSAPRSGRDRRGPEERFDVAEDLGELVGLRDEEVRAHLLRQRLIPLLRARREDDDRDLAEPLVEFQEAADLVAVELRQHEVEED